jgi:APA family basic amino acid/polyamine antiporter
MYSFGAMLSFTIAHASVIALRLKSKPEEAPFRAKPSLTIAGRDIALFAVIGGLGTLIAWLVVVIQTPSARYAGLGWLVVGFVTYTVYRRRILRQSMTVTLRAPIAIGPSLALEYRRILVPMGRDRESEEAVDLACRLAADRGATITALTVLEIPMELPLSADLPEKLDDLYDLLDEAKAIGDSYGIKVQTRLIRARNFGRAIVDEAARRNSEIIVVGADRRNIGGRTALFSDIVDFTLKHAPCRVMVAAAPPHAA